jgi:leucyl aminopeptidase
MNWVQEKFQVKTLIELSTLTGAVITALGSAFTGFFTNSEDFFKEVNSVGAKVNELSWQLPCSDYHKRLVSPKHCDLTNNSGKSEASASQAAAFLRSFVEEGVVWAHLDIGGTADLHGDVTGWGTRLLIEYARSKSQ